MLHLSRWKVTLAALSCLLAFYFSAPNFVASDASLSSLLPDAKMQLGLDLQGGSYLLLEVDVDTYMADQLEQLKEDMRRALRDAKLGYRGLHQTKDSVRFTPLNDASEEAFQKAVGEISLDLEIEAVESGLYAVSYSKKAQEAMLKNVVEQSIEIVRRRVDETGTREPIIQRQGDRRILLQVPGLQDPALLKSLLGKTAKLTFHLMHPSNPFPSQRMPAQPGMRLLQGDAADPESAGRFYMIRSQPMITGDMLSAASVGFDQMQQPVVNIRFNSIGAKRFAKTTSENVEKPFAMVLDNKVISAPVIREAITGGSAQISGNFNVQSANELAMLLRAGALPAPLQIVEERTVGPSLGEDSIEAGIAAGVVGFACVCGLIILCYGLFGLFAVFGLVINMALLFAVLSVLDATLTLPGIAGLVLTMGMSVDANVLIFERMREEMGLGKSPYAIIDMGFKRALATIFDSNITTLFAAFILFVMGSGAIKGFAVTLSVGIITSMYSATTLTRYMVVGWVLARKPKAIPL